MTTTLMRDTEPGILCQYKTEEKKKCWVVSSNVWVKYGKTQPLGFKI